MHLRCGMRRDVPPTFEELRGLIGQELGISDWKTVDQERINQFAGCTDDRQWIHVDEEQARRKSPVRTTIAHGYLSLSLIGAFIQEMCILPENTQGAFNYGIDHLRFIAPVRAGRRVRLRTTLVSIEDKGPGQYLIKGKQHHGGRGRGETRACRRYAGDAV